MSARTDSGRKKNVNTLYLMKNTRTNKLLTGTSVRDVAKKIGYSPAKVSRILNKKSEDDWSISKIRDEKGICLI